MQGAGVSGLNPKGLLVLVVDDYADSREMYADFLAFSGFRVVEARDGREALEKAAEVKPDLILMDLSLPGVDGWEATRRLKSDPRTREIPVVALTGHAFAGDADSALQAGCDAFITKPCLPADLVVQARVERKRLGGGMRQVGILAAAGLVALERVDRLAEDHERARRLASLILLKQPEVNAALFVAPARGCDETLVSVRYAQIGFEVMGLLYERQQHGNLTTVEADRQVWRRLAA